MLVADHKPKPKAFISNTAHALSQDPLDALPNATKRCIVYYEVGSSAATWFRNIQMPLLISQRQD